MSELYQDAISDLQHSELLDPIRTPDRRSPEHESGEADKNLSYFFPTGDDATAGGASADEEAGVPAKPSWYAVVFMVFCPCLLGDPLSADKRQEYRRAIKTMCLIITILQIVLFIVSISLHGITDPSENWLIGPSAHTLSDMGAKNTYLLYTRWHLQRWFSPMFLHAGIIHIFINLFAQLRMGLFLERRWGWIKFTSIYICSGMYGIMISCVLQPKTISVAASACVLGLTGAYTTQILITWHKMGGFQRFVAVLQCFIVLLVLSLIEIGPDFIDWSANMGAIVCGMAMGFIVFGKEYAQRKHVFMKRVLPALCALFIVLSYAGGIVLFYSVLNIPSSDPSAD